MTLVEKIKKDLIEGIKEKYEGRTHIVRTNCVDILEAGLGNVSDDLGIGAELEDSKLWITIENGQPTLQKRAWDFYVDEDDDEPESTKVNWEDFGVQLLIDIYEDKLG